MVIIVFVCSSAERATQERETARQVDAQRLDYEEQIFKLKQENFVLAARVSYLSLMICLYVYVLSLYFVSQNTGN